DDSKVGRVSYLGNTFYFTNDPSKLSHIFVTYSHPDFDGTAFRVASEDCFPLAPTATTDSSLFRERSYLFNCWSGVLNGRGFLFGFYTDPGSFGPGVNLVSKYGSDPVATQRISV